MAAMIMRSLQHYGDNSSVESQLHLGPDTVVFDDRLSNVAEKYRGTQRDVEDMTVLGKKQVLRRNFSFITIVSFSSSCNCSWEAVFGFMYFYLINGGPAFLFWGFLICAIGCILVYASLAEMASISPTSGGQYHWVSEFAPLRMQKTFSYFSGWLIAIGWQVYTGATCFVTGTLIQGLIALNNVDYIFQRWHGTLLSILIIVFSIIFMTVLASRLPLIEGIVMVLHSAGAVAIVTCLWVMGPRQSAEFVLLDLVNKGGWPSAGLSAMVSLVTPMTFCIGYDSCVHMAEEIADASFTLPRALMGSVLFNFTVTLVVLLSTAFMIGDMDSLLATTTGYPCIQFFLNVTHSYAATNAITAVLIVILGFCSVSDGVAASRQLWSFARDKGVPCHSWICKVSPDWNIPTHAVIVTLSISALLCTINIGSTVALNAFSSLAAGSLIISYILTIGCFVHRRLRGPSLPDHRWSLGKFGLGINIAALLFLIPLLFFSTWPLMTPVTLVNMNWSSVMLVGVLLIAGVYYIIQGRFEYQGPVTFVKRNE